uniref:Uncharacterized protein n=1 Tax=Cucumis melo TaxID=3656 RepID=A0A9I9E7I4_CUCME
MVSDKEDLELIASFFDSFWDFTKMQRRKRKRRRKTAGRRRVRKWVRRAGVSTLRSGLFD